jgi:hypothetical protein
MTANTGATTVDFRSPELHPRFLHVPQEITHHARSHKDTHHSSKNTKQVIVIHDPYAAPYWQSPSNHPHEIATKHTLRPLILLTFLTSFSTPLPLHPFLLRPQRRYVAPEPGPSCCWPQHPFPTFVEQSNSHNQFRPYEDPEHDIWDEGDLPLLRALIRKSIMVESHNASHGDTRLDSEARRPRRLFNLLMRLTYLVAYLDSSTATFCLTRQSQQSCSTSALINT